MIYPLDKQNTNKLKNQKPTQLIQGIAILFWVLVFGFMYLVSVDPMDRSFYTYLVKTP